MCRISTTKAWAFAAALASVLIGTNLLADTLLVQPLKQLFDHSKHKATFQKMSVRCVDCHSFAYKPIEKGPLASPLPHGLLNPPKQVCHQCHVGKIALPRPNQCLLCHNNIETIKPKDHLVDWRHRHGLRAQMNKEACMQCHTQASCSQCHLKQDVLNPTVHPPNFRFSHSVYARARPQSCVECHRSTSFCMDCHTGAVRR